MIPRAASRLFVGNYSERAIIQVAEDLRREIGTDASLGIFYATSEWKPYLEDTLELIRLYAHVPQIVGCSGWGIIGVRSEVEKQPGFSLMLLAIPQDSFSVHEITEELVEASDGPGYWQTVTALSCKSVACWIILGNPHFGWLEQWLDDWNSAYPGTPILGGLASSVQSDIFLLHDAGITEVAALAIAFKHGLRVSPLVSQGCRPIGEPSPITKAEENMILEIGNLPAYQALEAAFLSIPAEERATVRNNLFLGFAISEYIEDFKQGDFLIRNILGADPQVGALAVGALPRIGQTVQFQLRDSKSAHEDLVAACQRIKPETRGSIAALLFSCAGRGKGLFSRADHDAGTLAETLGDLPLAGFFGNGEIGPVGGKAFLHGYTASAAILCTA